MAEELILDHWSLADAASSRAKPLAFEPTVAHCLLRCRSRDKCPPTAKGQPTGNKPSTTRQLSEGFWVPVDAALQARSGAPQALAPRRRRV